jgi:hypothetical protein
MGIEKQIRNDKIRVPVDILARNGHFDDRNMPGYDMYDSGLDADKGLIPDTSTAESAGLYHEHSGPIDLKIRNSDKGSRTAKQDGLTELGEIELHAGTKDEMEGDVADMWLRKNDPNLSKQ